ncbi:MAG: hypothetical protein OEV91_04065 [Desulfobulbaceae bacterium]|nr:hypothetical protein [Desulfobulbaceae bacterium]
MAKQSGKGGESRLACRVHYFFNETRREQNSPADNGTGAGRQTMTTTRKTDKERIAEKFETTTLDNVATGVSQAAMGVIVCLAGIIGVWGLVCLFNGLAKSGSLSAFLSNYMRAVGM